MNSFELFVFLIALIVPHLRCGDRWATKKERSDCDEEILL